MSIAVRVLIVHPRDLGAPTGGGIQTFLHDFVKHAPKDFEITLAGVTNDRGARPIGRRSRVKAGGGTAWMLPLAASGRLARSPMDLVRMAVGQLRLRRHMLDRQTILQIHRPFRPILLAGHRGPRVQFVHLDMRAWPGPSGWPRMGHLYRPFSDRALARMDRVYVVNDPGVEMLRNAHPQMAERISLLPVWYDDEIFQLPQPGERDAVRADLAERLGIGLAGPTDRWVLLAGRVDPLKDPLLALDVFGRLVAKRAATLIVAGEGELRGQLSQEVDAAGLRASVRFVGDLSRDELATLMRASDALLLTSTAEGGGPRVVVESLASGLPVVTTDVGDVRRTVTGGVNGWIAPLGDADALVEGLRWVFDQPREQIAQAAALAVEPYTARRILEPLYATYRRLATGRDDDAQP